MAVQKLLSVAILDLGLADIFLDSFHLCVVFFVRRDHLQDAVTVGARKKRKRAGERWREKGRREGGREGGRERGREGERERAEVNPDLWVHATAWSGNLKMSACNICQGNRSDIYV